MNFALKNSVFIGGSILFSLSLIPAIWLFLMVSVFIYPFMLTLLFIAMAAMKFQKPNFQSMKYLLNFNKLPAYGMNEMPELKMLLRKKIAELIDIYHDTNEGMACACVKKINGQFTGNLLIKCPEGNFITVVEAVTKRASIIRLIEKIDIYKTMIPGYYGRTYIPNQYCNMLACPNSAFL